MERSRSTGRSRRAALLVFIVVLLLLGIWWAWPTEVEQPAPAPPPPQVVAPPPPPPAEPTPIVVIDAGPEPVVEVAPIVVPDAGTKIAAKDAGTRVTYSVSSTHYLKEGNKASVIPESEHPFQQACRREANACAVNELFWDDPPSQADFKLESAGQDVVVTGLGGRMKIGGNERFWSCLERALKAAPMVGVEPGGRSCMLHHLSTAVNDKEEVVKKVGECLGPVSAATSIELSWDLVVRGRQVEVQKLKVTPNVPIDGYAQRCIEQAASAPPRVFTEDTRPPFTERHVELTVMTYNEGGPSNQRGIREFPVPGKTRDGSR